MKEIVLASGNAGKLRELDALLAGLDCRVRAQSEFAVPPVEESGGTFVENAIIKARHAARHCTRPALADDSGLMVAGLGGAPGVWSARYAGARASDEDNLRQLLEDARELPEHARACRYVCVMACLRDADDPLPLIACAEWRGRLLTAPRGRHGFGYDPIFLVPEFACSAAELEPAIKNRVSHRAQALAALRDALALEFGP